MLFAKINTIVNFKKTSLKVTLQGILKDKDLFVWTNVINCVTM